jgi:hypothetical protein
MRFATGDSYQDKAFTKHLIFRNGDQSAPLKYLIAPLRSSFASLRLCVSFFPVLWDAEN